MSLRSWTCRDKLIGYKTKQRVGVSEYADIWVYGIEGRDEHMQRMTEKRGVGKKKGGERLFNTV